MKVVQETLGHASMSTTANIYSHVVPELQTEAVAKVSDMLWGAS